MTGSLFHVAIMGLLCKFRIIHRDKRARGYVCSEIAQNVAFLRSLPSVHYCGRLHSNEMDQ